MLVVVAEVDNTGPVSDESGEGQEDELSMVQMAEGSGVFLPAEPRGKAS